MYPCDVNYYNFINVTLVFLLDLVSISNKLSSLCKENSNSLDIFDWLKISEKIISTKIILNDLLGVIVKDVVDQFLQKRLVF